MIRYYLSLAATIVAVLTAVIILLLGVAKNDKAYTVMGAIAVILGAIDLVLPFIPRFF